jgi:hypothetical protein
MVKQIAALSVMMPCSPASIEGLISQNPQPQAQLTYANLDLRHLSGEWANSCAHRSMYFCSQRGGGVSKGLQLQSCDWGRMAVRFVRLALKIIRKNNRDFVDIILLQSHNIQTRARCHNKQNHSLCCALFSKCRSRDLILSL